MTKKIKFLGIKAAGRKDANTEILLNELLRAAMDQGHKVTRLDLTTVTVKHCIGCGACSNKELKCMVKDDFLMVCEMIEQADAIALAAPCYAVGAPSVLKALADRYAGRGLVNIANQKKRKYGAIASVAGGNSNWFSLQRAFPALLLGLSNCELVGQFTVEETALKGEALLKPSRIKHVQELGALLLKSATHERCYKYGYGENESRLICPVCFSDVFNVDGRGKYTCCVCHSTIGKYASLERILKNYEKRPARFGDSRFDKNGVNAHFEHIARKMAGGIKLSEETKKRLQKYLAHDMLPEHDYILGNKPEDEGSTITWEVEAIEYFDNKVPGAFKRIVKKAVEQKAAARGATVITKELFMLIKKEAGVF